MNLRVQWRLVGIEVCSIYAHYFWDLFLKNFKKLKIIAYKIQKFYATQNNL